MKMDKRKVTVNYSFTIKVRFLLVISFITNSLVFWQNCVYVLADISQDKRLTTRIVTTKYGSLRGLHLNLPHNLQPIEMFLGIPYASPPTGKLRFMPPVTPAHWPGIRIADKHGPVCPQRLPDIRNETEALQKMNHDRLVNLKRLIPLLQNQSEDCLYLNIYTPAKASKSSSSYPVIMFIHGESYEWNSGSAYDGSILSSFGNLIVVTINYRLGVLGFYPAMDGSSRGNFGLMDQVAALHWIQENIEEFGGNPSNVTIHGHGYGAALVNLLMLSPMAKGLFHRAIMQSGSALCPWALAFNAIKYGREFAQAVGCYQEGFKNSHIVDCLRHKTVPELLSVQLASPRFLTGFGPMVDGIVIASDPLALMNDPSSTFSSYSLLIGLTRLESYNLLSSTDFEEGISEQRRDKIIRTLVRNIYSYHLQEIYLTISNEYTDWTQSNPNNQLLLESLSELLSDALFVGPVVKTAMIHSKLTKSTKLYYFSHTSALMLTNHSRLVSVHGQDLPYSFGQYFNHFDSKIDLHHNGNHSRVDIILSEIIMKYWSNFAKSGDPNNREGSLNGLESRLESIHWPSYDPIQQQYLLLNTKPKIKDHYHAHRLSYWLNLIPKLHSTGTSASFEHHLLEDHDNIQTYEGLVRNVFASLNLDRIPDLPVNKSDFMIFGKIEPQLKSSHRNQTTVSNENQSESNTNTANRSANFGQIKGAFDRTDLLNGSFSMIVQDNPYSTALSVTIAVGCSLLILNILVFAGVFLHRDRTIREGQDNSNCQRESICGESRGSQYKYNSRVKFTKVKNEVGPTCIHHCPYNVDSAVTENYANCSGYHYQTSPEACSASISGPGDDHCNCPLVNLAYYVCDCRETEISGHHHHHHHHPDGPCKADEEEGDTDKVDKQIIGVSEEFETSQQLLTSS